MRDHKIITVFQAFEKKTCKRFEQFLASPYHNPSPKVQDLGTFLLSFYPAFSSPRLNEEEAYRILFPENPFSKHELTRYLSKLFAVLEDFVAIEALEETPFFKKSLISDFYYKHQNEIGLIKNQKQLKKSIATTEPRGSAHFFYSYLHEKLDHNFLMQKHKHEPALESLKAAEHSLNIYFSIETLQAAISMHYHQKRSGVRRKLPFIELVLAFIKARFESLPPLLQLWYNAYLLINNPKEATLYESFKQILKLNLRKIPPLDARNFTVILNTALNQQMDLGRERFLKERFDTYLIEIQEGWIIADNMVSPTTFNNIIVVTLALGHLEYADQFIENYQGYLTENVRQDITLLSQARLAFARKQYGDCLKLSQQVNYLDQSIGVAVKRLQTMCFFELRDEEQLFNSVNATKVYIHRLDESMARTKAQNNAFIKAVKLLDKLQDETSDGTTREDLGALIKKHPFMPEAEWVKAVLNSA